MMGGGVGGGRLLRQARRQPRNAARLRGRCGGRGGTRRVLSSSGMRASAAESSARHSALGSVHRMAAGVDWPVGVEVRARRLRARWSRGVAGRRIIRAHKWPPQRRIIDVSDCVLSVYDVRHKLCFDDHIAAQSIETPTVHVARRPRSTSRHRLRISTTRRAHIPTTRWRSDACIVRTIAGGMLIVVVTPASVRGHCSGCRDRPRCRPAPRASRVDGAL